MLIPGTTDQGIQTGATQDVVDAIIGQAELVIGSITRDRLGARALYQFRDPTTEIHLRVVAGENPCRLRITSNADEVPSPSTEHIGIARAYGDAVISAIARNKPEQLQQPS